MQSPGLMSLHPLCSLSSVFILVYLQIFQKESCEKNTQTWRNSKSTVWHSLKIEAIFFTVETFISIQQYPLLNLLFTDASIDLQIENYPPISFQNSEFSRRCDKKSFVSSGCEHLNNRWGKTLSRVFSRSGFFQC